LAEKKYNVIVRPHPHSMIYEKDFIIRIKGEFEKYENIIWDETINPSRSMNNADLLISDTSSIRFDFLFVHEKPVITLDVKSNQMQGFERAFLNKNWTDTISFDLGPVLTKDTISKLDTEINNLFENFKPSEIYKLREKTILNFGKGADSITNYFINAENN
jgi:CDP-glycerol glycerophosphotransferase (TagB/SpsB family)